MPTAHIPQRVASSTRGQHGSAFFIAHNKQVSRLQERRSADVVQVSVCRKRFDVFPGVYDTGLDTELMIGSVAIDKVETFLEVGCGAGAISIVLSERCRGGLGVDINPAAVSNSRHNARLCGADNVSFLHSDVFQNVHDQFDVIVCNPPYSAYPAQDVIDKMFWDPANKMKRQFFHDVREHLRDRGRVYFGWADFGDIERDLPTKLAGQHDLRLNRILRSMSPSGDYSFLVFEFRKAHSSSRLAN